MNSFGGVIRVEEQDGAACALEAASVARGREFSDSPRVAGLPDLRPLSDGYCIWLDDETRTEHLVPLVKALWGWPQWSRKQQAAWKRRVSERTIREILPCVLRPIGLEAEAERCARTGTVKPEFAALEAALAKTAHSPEELLTRLDAGRVKNAADYAKKAACSRDTHDMALAVYQAASALHCMAISRATADAASDIDTARYMVAGVSAVDILSLACRIWREEAERIRQPRSS